MSRPYPAHAYSNAPRAGCFWPTTTPPLAWPQLNGAIKADVAIIGGGVTGLSAALHLAEAGVDVVVLDTHQPGWGASGRNGGFCCLGGAKADDRAIARQFGSAAPRAWKQTERAAVDLVDHLVTRLNLDVDRHSNGETVLAHSPAAWDAMQREADSVPLDYGVTPHLIAPQDMAANGMAGPYHGALTIPIGFGLNPVKYLTGLAHAASTAGATCFGETTVTQMTPTAQGWALTTPTGSLQARKVIIATNGYSSDHLPDWLKGRFLPAQSAVLVTRPFTNGEAQAQGWTTDQMAFTAREFLHYFRRMPDGRMLFGMRGSLLSSPQADKRAQTRLMRAFTQMFPKFAQEQPPHMWSGLVSLSRDLTPFCGPVPETTGLYAALNYHGNGVAMGSYCGALLADLITQGKTDRPYPSVLSSPPSRFPFSNMRRHLLWPAYAWRMLQDR